MIYYNITWEAIVLTDIANIQNKKESIKSEVRKIIENEQEDINNREEIEQSGIPDTTEYESFRTPLYLPFRKDKLCNPFDN